MTLADFDRLIDDLYRRPPPPPAEQSPSQSIDWEKVFEHGIRMGYDPSSDMWLMSSSEMRRAREVGAIVDVPADNPPET